MPPSASDLLERIRALRADLRHQAAAIATIDQLLEQLYRALRFERDGMDLGGSFDEEGERGDGEEPISDP